MKLSVKYARLTLALPSSHDDMQLMQALRQPNAHKSESFLAAHGCCYPLMPVSMIAQLSRRMEVDILIDSPVTAVIGRNI